MPCPLPYSIFLVCQLRSLTVVFRLPERSRFPPDQHLTNNTKIVWTQWTCDLLIFLNRQRKPPENAAIAALGRFSYVCNQQVGFESVYQLQFPAHSEFEYGRIPE